MATDKKSFHSQLESGQSLVEYTLIVVLCIFAFAFALAATGPAIGNVFSNTIFNLIGQSGQQIVNIPNGDNFWLTVTWVATQTPQETPLATLTTLPPTTTPTAGPSPTPTNTVPPTAIPPTFTPPPTPTLADFAFVAPWTDSANAAQVVNWRLDNANSYFGSEDWLGSYYSTTNFTGPTFAEGENRNIIGAPSAYQVINQNYGVGGPVAGGPADNFSVRWRRPVDIKADTTLVFDVPVVRNGGVRVFILGNAFGGNADHRAGSPGSCSSQLRRGGSAGQFVRSDDPLRTTGLGQSNTVPTPQNNTRQNDSWHVVDQAYVTAGGASASECLVIDRWYTENVDRSVSGVSRFVPAGKYLIVVEYAHTSNDSKIAVNVRNARQSINPDDASLGSGQPDCAFNNADTTRADSLAFTWEEYRGDNNFFRPQMRCYLELRGSVEIPAGMADPKLTFWDVWDVRAGVKQWVEIADYDPNNDGVFDRAALAWVRTDLHQNDTFNYNWTFNTVDLVPRLVGNNSRKLAVRFGMERTDSATEAMKWYLDSITIDNMPTRTLFMNKQWNLDDMTQKADFIASGNWNLTSEFPMGSGMSWHESPDIFTTNIPESRNGTGSYADGDLRMHTIEFNGFVDLDNTSGVTDYEGDQGDPILTFFHRYQLGNRTGLEIQYTTTPYGVGAANWQLVPSAGQIIARNNTTVSPEITTFEQVTVNLKDIPVRRFRLRFAMTVNALAPLKAGWWIENIKLERSGRIRYLQYPFVDSAEDPAAIQTNYNLVGTWTRVEGGNRPATGQNGWAYTDSPSDNYKQNTDNVIAFRRVFDLYNDTPDNAYSPVCTLPGSLCETDNVNPVRPVMNFWHRRILTANTTISVEWKRNTEPVSGWKSLWVYSGTNSRAVSVSGSPSTQSDRTRINQAWERVQIDFAPIFARLLADLPTTRTDTNKLDDDINIRIRFNVGAAANPTDGVYFDDIRIEEYNPTVWALWAVGATRNDIGGSVITTSGTPVSGSGITYLDTLDNRPWFDIWHVGGGWNAVSFEKREGVLAFHDSTTVVGATTNKAPDFAQEQGTNGLILDQTFNTLEMRTIFDLRGTQTTDRPIFYFWTRWFAENNVDYLSVQISAEDPTNTAGCPTAGETQCYQKEFGWTPWTTVWSTTGSREYLWERNQIDLSSYAATTLQNGKRIRIRFVSDALRTSPSTNHRDGWYIDNMSITFFQPRVTFIGNAVAGGGAFTDKTRSTDNWITEGRWGLTPTLFRGSPGPVSLGGNPWNFSIWRDNQITAAVPGCNSLGWAECSNRFLNNNASAITPFHTGMVTDIRQNWGGSGPTNAGGTRITDKFVYRWTMTTPTNLVASRYTFITAADDGVRLRFDTVPAGGLPAAGPDDPPNYTSTWNIVNNWQSQGRTTTVSSASILGGANQYRFVMEYFEDSGDASVQLTIGTNAFSLTAQPPNGTGRLESDQVPVMRNSNASIISKGVFDLTQSVKPILRYFTYYELGGLANVEVSQDGGFTWVRTGLQGSATPPSLWTTDWWGYYWNGRVLDSASGGWPSPPPNFTTQPYTTFNGAPQRRNEGNAFNYNWSGVPGPTGINADNFSVRFVRKLATTDATTLRFTVRGDDGYRLWVNYVPGCAVVGGNPARPVFSGVANSWNQTNTTFSDPSASCLLIDDWQDQGPDERSVTRSIPAGATIMLDYFDSGGGAEISMTVTAGSFNAPQWSGTYMPDDTVQVMQQGWQQRIHDLSSYAGPGQPPIMLRFRLDRRGESSTDTNPNDDNGGVFNYPVGWWLADFELFEP